ncbi:T-box [Teladorsagia circumcincta]|uniref:T-box n=1 Tax=Teladorsagia circumcincta TaxID=45464 RepID=A0A2G9TX21_TELCI|nr:T-box [Teladorsagia circumcincta]
MRIEHRQLRQGSDERKMFPKLEYAIEGLDPTHAYGLVLQIEQVDDNRYKFSGGEWSAAGRGESGGVSKNVMHHDGVMPGAHWMRQPIFLQSMHKYIPVLSIFEIAQSETPFLSASTSHPPKQATPSPKRVYSPHQHPYAALFDKPMSVMSATPPQLGMPPMWPAFYPSYWNPYSYMLNPLLAARFGAAPK